MRHRVRLALFSALSLGLMTAIFFFSAQPGAESARMSGGLLATPFGQWLSAHLPPITGKGAEHDLRKLAHMFEFFCLTGSYVLLARELTAGRSRRRALPFALAELGCFLYACTDELHQAFVPRRSAQFGDVLIDCLGGLAALLVTAPLLLWIDARRDERTNRR